MPVPAQQLRPMTPEEQQRLLSTLEQCREQTPPLLARWAITWAERKERAAKTRLPVTFPANAAPEWKGWSNWLKAPVRHLRATLKRNLWNRCCRPLLRRWTGLWLKRALASLRIS